MKQVEFFLNRAQGEHLTYAEHQWLARHPFLPEHQAKIRDVFELVMPTLTTKYAKELALAVEIKAARIEENRDAHNCPA